MKINLPLYKNRTVQKIVLFPKQTHAEINYASDVGLSVFVRDCVLQRLHRCSLSLTLLPADPPGDKKKAVNVRWTEKEFYLVQKSAKRTGYRVTVFIRMCVQDFLDTPIEPVIVPQSNVDLFG